MFYCYLNYEFPEVYDAFTIKSKYFNTWEFKAFSVFYYVVSH